jgi:hypothetical protein
LGDVGYSVYGIRAYATPAGGKRDIYFIYLRRVIMKKRSVLVVLGMLVMAFVLAGCGSSPASQRVDLPGVTSYYVRADGSDANTGTSEEAPFKTLAKAVEAAAKTSVKKITVIGTLVENVVIKNTDPTVGKRTKLVDKTGDTMGTVMITWSVDERDPEEILITGKPDASDTERAVLTPANYDNNTLTIGLSTIRFEHIEISGQNSAEGSSALGILGGTVTLAEGAKVTRNKNGGVFAGYSVLIMRDDAEVSGNEKDTGAGFHLLGSITWSADYAD